MNDFEKTLMRSANELPYPMNYMHLKYPGAAYMIMKVFDKMNEKEGGCR